VGAEGAEEAFRRVSADRLNYAPRTYCVRRQLDRADRFGVRVLRPGRAQRPRWHPPKPERLVFSIVERLASLMWSGQGTAVKVLDRHMGPIALHFYRST